IKCRRGGLINYIAYVQASRFCSSHSGFASFVRKICRDCNHGFADRPQFACCSLLELLQYEGAELGGGKFPSSNKIAFRGSHISFESSGGKFWRISPSFSCKFSYLDTIALNCDTRWKDIATIAVDDDWASCLVDCGKRRKRRSKINTYKRTHFDFYVLAR